ncbi:radical SAM protein [bacterium]|nr:radical SAM protein [bacterium]
MFKKFVINQFNKKYSGKELFFCEKIYEDILFWPFTVHKCCHCTKMPYSPPLITKEIPKKFNFYDYIKKIDTIMSENQNTGNACVGCKFLKKQIVPELKTENIFKFITINHFTKCNSNCIYCGIGRKTEDIKFHLLPILKDMVKQKLINKDVLFNWGGGEPTMCSEFEEIAKFLHEHKYRQAINSSGIIFSNTIFEGLKDGSMSIQISPDSGTEETYKKIKRQNNFFKVWENIKKYAQFPDMLFVKYIFFSVSANETDIRKFIEKCVNSDVKNIVIDCESKSANNPNSQFGKITQDIVDLAVLMKHLAIENNINYQISYQWKDEHKKYIEEN